MLRATGRPTHHAHALVGLRAIRAEGAARGKGRAVRLHTERMDELSDAKCAPASLPAGPGEPSPSFASRILEEPRRTRPT
eukprot:11169694-Lingulodinium_polyedra.AAC.1